MISEERLLLGPGPSNVSPRVLAALSRPLLGHLDPDFIRTMNSIQDLLRKVFRTSNRFTIPVSATGSAGMEACLANFVEENDPVLVGAHGVFGQRIAEMVRRHGGAPVVVEGTFGEPLSEKKMREAALSHRPKLLAVVHAETSTGVLQPIEPMRDLARQTGALLLVDTVTSLGGHPVDVDGWGIDLCYSGTQKCLSCPPGLSPITVSAAAEERLAKRRTPCRSWYLDLKLVSAYWGESRVYHHTAPVSLNFALQEALEVVLEEGLERRWDRHRRNHLALVAGIEGLGLEMLVSPEYRLWSLNTIRIPEGIDDAGLRRQLLQQHDVEIGGGLGPLQGRVWRVGLMGENSQPGKVLYFLFALEQCLRSQGFECGSGAGVQAAAQLYAREDESKQQTPMAVRQT